MEISKQLKLNIVVFTIKAPYFTGPFPSVLKSAVGEFSSPGPFDPAFYYLKTFSNNTGVCKKFIYSLKIKKNLSLCTKTKKIFDREPFSPSTVLFFKNRYSQQMHLEDTSEINYNTRSET